MNNVEIISENDGDVVVVYLKGQALDASNVQRFRTETTPLFDDAKNFIFIFQDLKFVDSSGIGALLSCLRRAHAAGGDVRLAELQPGVKQLFELVRMNRLFEIFETFADARASYSG
jgi:anti-sigma B factor antagonist